MTFGRNRQNIRGVVGGFALIGIVAPYLHGGGEAPSLIEGVLQFEPTDFDIGDVEFVLRHFGTEDDKPPMSVRRDEASLVSFGEEAVFAAFEMVSKPSFEHSGEGQTLF